MNSFDAVLLTAPDGQILEANEEACRIFGYTQEELRKIGREDTVDKSDPRLANGLEERRRKGKFRGELNLIRKDGTKFPAEISSAIFNDKEGNLRTSMIIRDVTERKRAEEALIKSELRFRNCFDLPLIGFAITSTEKRWIEVNDRICSILGYSQDEIVQRTWSELTHPDDLAADIEQFNLILSGQIEKYSMDKRFIRKDGQVVWTSISVGCVRKPDGRVDYIIGLMEDITERKQNEEALRESEERYRKQFEEAIDAIFLADLGTGMLVDCNIAASKLVEREKSEIIGKHQSFLHPAGDIKDGCSKTFKSHMTGESSELLEDRVITKSRQIKDVAIRASKITIEGKEVMQGIFRDITKRKQAEKALKVREKELEINTENLEEINTALNVLLKKREEDKTELEEKVLLNIKQLVEPYISKLKQSRLDERQKALASILESNLKDITSSFSYSLSSRHLNLTPSEVKIANLIKQDKTSKEICEILGSSQKVVAFHRQNIRRKLGLQNKKVNLKSYLMTKA